MKSVSKYEGKAILKIYSASTLCQLSVTNSQLLIQNVELNGNTGTQLNLIIPFASREHTIKWIIYNNLIKEMVIISYDKKYLFCTLENSLGLLKPFLDGQIPYNSLLSLYTIDKQIKQLKGGQVMKVTNKLTNQIEVAKQINFGSNYDSVHNKMIYNEIAMAQYFTQFPHQNLLKLLVFVLEKDSVILIFEYIQNTSLYTMIFQYPAGVPFEVLRKIMKTILKAIRHMHQHKIMHRDIKMDNILIRDINDPKSIVIIDYGFATSVQQRKKQLHSKCGTLGYFAPEILVDDNYNELCDIFSVAQVFLKLLNGSSEEFQTSEDKFPVLTDLLQQMNQDKEFRLSAQQCLDHDFFMEGKIANNVMKYSQSITFKHPCSN